MALPVIEIDGTDVVDADEVADRSVSIRRRSLDLTLINPSTFPSVGDTVTCDAPAWTGTINRLQTREWADALYVQVTATNLSNLTTSSAPFGLSDTPNGSTTFGYRDLEITHAQGDTETEITGSVETFEPGINPGMFIEITSVLHDYSAESFYVRDVTVRWQTKDGPVYTLTLAKPLSTAVDPDDPIVDGDLPDEGTLGEAIRDIAEDAITGNGSGACCGLECAPLLGDGGSSLAEWQITHSPDAGLYDFGVVDGAAYITRESAGADDSDFLTCILVLPDDYRDQFPNGFLAGFSVIWSGDLDVDGDHREAEAKMTIGGTSGGGWDMTVTAGRQSDTPGIPDSGYLIVAGDANGTPYSDNTTTAQPVNGVANAIVVSVSPTGASVSGLGDTIPISESFDTDQFQSIQLTLSLNLDIEYTLQVTAVNLVPLTAGGGASGAPWCDHGRASRVGLSDAGGYYTSNNVEDALQEAAQRSAFFEDAGSGTVKFRTGYEQLLDTNETAYLTLDAAYAEIGTNDAYFVGDDDSVFINAAEEVDVQAAHGLIVPRLGADPASPADGAIWYRTDTDKLRLRANGSTVDLN